MRLADVDWLAYVSWEAVIECEKPVNRRDRLDQTSIHRIVVRRNHENVPVREAIKEAQIMAEEHEAEKVGGLFSHRVKEIGIFWHGSCKKDRTRIAGWNIEEFFSRIEEHEMSEVHQKEERVAAALDMIVESLKEGL